MLLLNDREISLQNMKTVMFSKILISEPKLSGSKFEPILSLLYYLLVVTGF